MSDTKKLNKKASSPLTRKRCKKGERKNKEGKCVPKEELEKRHSLPSPENIEKLDKVADEPKIEEPEPEPEPEPKKKRCSKGERRNKEGKCVPKEELLKGKEDKGDVDVDADADADAKKEPQPKDKRVELLLGDVIQINNKDDFHYINYIDEQQVDLINVDTKVAQTIRIENEFFMPRDEITQITLIYQNPLRGFIKQHHFVLNSWIAIHFRNDPHPFIVKITDIKQDMMQIYSADTDTYYFINFKYQGIPKSSNIDYIVLLDGPPATEAKKADETKMMERLVDEDEDDADADADADAKDLHEKEKITILDEPVSAAEGEGLMFEEIGIDAVADTVSTKDVDVDTDARINVEQPSSAVVFLGEFPMEIEKSSYNRFGLTTQVNDLLESKLAKIPADKRTAYAVNKIHTLITRYKQLRNQTSIFDEDGVIYDVVRKSSQFRSLVKYLEKYQNNLAWIYLVANNLQKEFCNDDPDKKKEDAFDTNRGVVACGAVTEGDEEDENEGNDFIPMYQYLNAMEEVQKQFNVNWQELNMFFTPFYNSASDLPISNAASTLVAKPSGDDELYFDCATRKYITGQIRVIKEKNSKVISKQVLMNNDAISSHSLVALPIAAAKETIISLPGTNILARADLAATSNPYWRYLLSLLSAKTQANRIEPREALIKTGHYFREDERDNRDNRDEIKQRFSYDKSLFSRENKYKSIYFSSDAIQQSESSWSDYLHSVIPYNSKIVEQVFANKYNIHALDLNAKLSIMNIVQALEPFLIYANDTTYSFLYGIVKQKLRNQLREYRQAINQGQKYYDGVNQLLAKNVALTARHAKEIEVEENRIKEINTDYSVRETMQMVNQNKYLLFSENVKHILLAINDRILEKSETVHVRQLKKEDNKNKDKDKNKDKKEDDNKCTIQHFVNEKEMFQYEKAKHGRATVAAAAITKNDTTENKENDNNAENSPNVLDAIELADVDDGNIKSDSHLFDEIFNFYTLKNENKKKKYDGSQFIISNNKKTNTRTFEIKCKGGTRTKCAETTISTNYIYYTEKVMRELRANIKRIQTDIVILKNDALFGYKNVERINSTFQGLKRDLLNYLTQYINALQYVMKNCDKLDEVNESKKELEKYVVLLDKEADVKKIVSNYVEHIYPIAEQIRTQTYNVNVVNKIVKDKKSEITEWITNQQKCSDKMHEYNIYPLASNIKKKRAAAASATAVATTTTKERVKAKTLKVTDKGKKKQNTTLSKKKK